MEKLKKAEALLVRLEGAALVTLLTVMMVMAFLQVAARQCFGTGLLWGDTFLRHLVLWVGFLGAAMATADEKNFAFEALQTGLSGKPRARAALALAAQLCGAAVGALLTRASWIYLLAEHEEAKALFTAGGFEVPAWAFAVILPLGFLLVTLHSLLKAAEAAAKLR